MAAQKGHQIPTFVALSIVAIGAYLFLNRTPTEPTYKIELVASASVPRMPQATTETLFVSQAITPNNQFGKGIEGAAVDNDGNLFVVNFGGNNSIGVVFPNEKAKLWLELPAAEAANAIRFNSQNEMFVADRKTHQLLKFNLTTKKSEVWAQNNRMNQPNDMAFARNGDLYLSDPSWNSKKSGNIWRIGTSVDSVREFHKVAGNLRAVNGIDLSPDEKKLYYSESISGSIFVFDILGGKLKNRRLLIKLEPNTVDGLRTDSAGNLFVARITLGRIDRLSPSGALLNSIKTVGQDPTNLAFGGVDGRSVYVTIRDGGYIESFRTEAPGREWQLRH